jgi:hypothetical protein
MRHTLTKTHFHRKHMKIQNLFIALTTSVFAVSSNPLWSVATAKQSIQNVNRQIPSTLITQMIYGTTRTNRTCPSRVNPKKGTLSLDQAKTYFICGRENFSGQPGKNMSSFSFVDNLKMQIASTSRSATDADLAMGYKEDIDLKQPVYPIRASYTSTYCSAYSPGNLNQEGKNCIANDIKGIGICFRNTFGDWYCKMRGSSSNQRENSVPPN